jgi:hypothetical protein
MDWATEYFQGLSGIVAAEEVRMGGGWAAKPQRRYVSPKQSGTGEGPFVETIDWRWDGTFEGASPLAGLVLLAVERRVFWAKSQPPSEHPVLSFSAHGWADAPRSVSVTGSFHGAYLPSVSIEIGDEPPAACTMGKPRASVGCHTSWLKSKASYSPWCSFLPRRFRSGATGYGTCARASRPGFREDPVTC